MNVLCPVKRRVPFLKQLLSDANNWGMLIIFTLSLFCNVLHHLISSKAPGGAKITSALASCLAGVYLAIEYGTRFEIRKKEKNTVKYTALKIWP